MSNVIVKSMLYVERCIQDDLFEPVILIVKCIFWTWLIIFYMYVFSRKIEGKQQNFSKNTLFPYFEQLYECKSGLIGYW